MLLNVWWCEPLALTASAVEVMVKIKYYSKLYDRVIVHDV